MKNTGLLLIIIASIAALLGALGYQTLSTPQKTVQHPSLGNKLGGDFSLQSADGTVTLKQYQGKVVVLYFGYTACPDVCPTTLGIMGQAFKQLSAKEQAQTQGLLITLDPERDTVERLAEYTPYFHPNILGLGGNLADITRIARQYGVMFFRAKTEDDGNYLVDHSSRTYVIGKSGQVAYLLPHNTSVSELVEKIRNTL
jgi:protein SCO1